jgi:hypothetical protein
MQKINAKINTAASGSKEFYDLLAKDPEGEGLRKCQSFVRCCETIKFYIEQSKIFKPKKRNKPDGSNDEKFS